MSKGKNNNKMKNIKYEDWKPKKLKIGEKIKIEKNYENLKRKSKKMGKNYKNWKKLWKLKNKMKAGKNEK